MSRIHRIALMTVSAVAINTAQNKNLDYRPEVQARRRNQLAQFLQQQAMQKVIASVQEKKQKKR